MPNPILLLHMQITRQIWDEIHIKVFVVIYKKQIEYQLSFTGQLSCSRFHSADTVYTIPIQQYLYCYAKGVGTNNVFAL